MASGRVVSWIRKHFVGFCFALAVLWLAFAVIQISNIVNGDARANGGHIFAPVLGLLLAALWVMAAIIASIAKAK